MKKKITKNIEFSQAISERICYDLASGIGAVENLLDIFREGKGEIREKAGEMVEVEAKTLVQRLRFYRGAYGLSSSDKNMSAVFLTKLIKDFFSNGRIKINIVFEEGIIYLESVIAKTLISLVSIINENICFSGKIDLEIKSAANKDGNEILIKGSGKRVRLKEDRASILESNLKLPINAHNCREHYVINLCVNSGYKLFIKNTDQSIEYLLKKE